MARSDPLCEGKSQNLHSNFKLVAEVVPQRSQSVDSTPIFMYTCVSKTKRITVPIYLYSTERDLLVFPKEASKYIFCSRRFTKQKKEECLKFSIEKM